MAVIEIFKTNVEELSEARRIVEKLYQHFPSYRINFDLHDCDRILRVEANGDPVNTDSIVDIVKQYSVDIAVIPD